MKDLAYGYKQPEKDDRGNVTDAALESNWQLSAYHNHDGVTSAPIDFSKVEKPVLIVTKEQWVQDTDDYKFTATLPSGYDFDKVMLECRITSGEYAGAKIYPTIKKLSSSQFNIHVDDPLTELRILLL